MLNGSRCPDNPRGRCGRASENARGVVRRPRAAVLADALRLPAGLGVHPHGGIRGPARPDGCTHRIGGAATSKQLSLSDRSLHGLRPVAHPLLARCLRPHAAWVRLDRNGACDRSHARGRQWSTHAGAVGDLPFVLSRGAGLLGIRLGDPAPGSHLPGCVPVPSANAAPHASSTRPAPTRHMDDPMAGISGDVRGRHDQDSRRCMLDRAHLSRVSLRNATDSTPPELALAPGPDVVPQGRCIVQPLRRARGSMVRIRTTTPAALRGSFFGRLSAASDPERQPLVSQLANPGGVPIVLRRRVAPAPAAPIPVHGRGRSRRPVAGESSAARGPFRPRLAGRILEPRSGRQHAVTAPGDEHFL